MVMVSCCRISFLGVLWSLCFLYLPAADASLINWKLVAAPALAALIGQRWIGEFCQYVGDACLIEPNSCLNGATCTTTSQPSSPPQYTCKCPPGFTGANCETEISECDSNPCQHNGTCFDFLGHYECQCPTGFLGKNCEVDIDACALPNNTCPPKTQCLDLPDALDYVCRVPCPQNLQNGATCVDEIDGYRGYTGIYCEEDIDYCVGHHCSEHGVCLDQRYNFTCRCMLGFEGSLCELETNECNSFPCASGATCVDLISDYRCHCPKGFEGFGGLNCEINYDECVYGYCANNSTCIDLVADYECVCPLGFAGLTGRFCETNVDDCEENPCGVLSICKDALNGYSCFCAPGFIGNNCEIEVNECLSQPCLNGGSCIDELNSFSCQCPLGITGDHCEVNIDECMSSPCLHNATCVDLVHGYGCVCMPGFTGHNCEFLPCEASNPCENGAVCVEELDQDRFPLGFRCHCRRGFSGPRCEINVDECSSSPCFHGFCYDGWTGVDCTEDVNECDSGPCLNGAQCQESNIPGEFSCTCPPFFSGPLCNQPYDPCDLLHNPCLNNSTCLTRSNGTAFCRCPAGE
ncbi:Fibropellin-1 Epidermal growth factor-related protein 1 [Collichthys lucidus]|uniref:Fibropellin-1 Epidermal growth factor-related protein 1 n=1 Tax=Collichthys lucidus TaxID=240159 RepID=A0A4U5VC10_COLLU|nr:Fibropellin-1 Epidermal growth factor-related protein 1 [Collichthys lucidus]